MDFDYTYYAPDLQALGSIFIGAMIFGMLISLCLYIVQAIGLYGISKKRGYNKPWLAFIPFANSYLLGAVADNINYCKQKKSSHRIILLVLNIIVQFASIGFFLKYLFNIFGSASSFILDEMYMAEEAIVRAMLNFLPIMMIVSLVGLVFTVFKYISLYIIFSDYAAQNAVLFLVLGIIFPITMPFFIFAIRNKQSFSLYYSQQQANYQQPINNNNNNNDVQ